MNFRLSRSRIRGGWSLTSEIDCTDAPEDAPKELTAEVTAAAADAPVLPAALEAALVPAKPCSWGPTHKHNAVVRLGREDNSTAKETEQGFDVALDYCGMTKSHMA